MGEECGVNKWVRISRVYVVGIDFECMCDYVIVAMMPESV